MISSPSEVNYPDQSCLRLGGLTIASKDIVPEYRIPKAARAVHAEPPSTSKCELRISFGSTGSSQARTPVDGMICLRECGTIVPAEMIRPSSSLSLAKSFASL